MGLRLRTGMTAGLRLRADPGLDYGRWTTVSRPSQGELMTLVRRIARPMLASMFIVGGVDTFRHATSKAPAAGPVVERVAGPLGLPEDTEMLVRANALAMVTAGGLLAAGRLPRIASLVLAGTLVPTTLAAHRYWEEQDEETRKAQRTHFFKNVSMLGGLLLGAVDTEGRPGLAYRAKMAGASAERAATTTRREARRAVRTARREARLKAVQAHDALA
jgi:putative oxidoreductase